jgi:hypothetical protein
VCRGLQSTVSHQAKQGEAQSQRVVTFEFDGLCLPLPACVLLCLVPDRPDRYMLNKPLGSPRISEDRSRLE